MEPRIMPITSNHGCLRFLRRASENGKRDEELRTNPVLAPWFDRIESQIGPITETMARLLNASSLRRVAVHKLNKCAGELKIITRDFREVLKRSAARAGKLEVLAYYKMPNKGTETGLTEDWYQTALWLVKGEEVALTNGFIAMTNPSVSDLGVIIERYNQESIEADQADRDYQLVQSEMNNLRSEANISARGLAANARLVLDGRGASSVRRSLRNLGYRFRGDAAEADTSPSEQSDEEVVDNPEKLVNSPVQPDGLNRKTDPKEPTPNVQQLPEPEARISLTPK